MESIKNILSECLNQLSIISTIHRRKNDPATAESNNFLTDLYNCISTLEVVIEQNFDSDIVEALLDNESKQENAENCLIENSMNMFNEISNLKLQLKRDRESFENRLETEKNNLRELKKSFFESKTENAIKLGYIEKYEESKLEHVQLKNEVSIAELRDKKHQLETDIDRELKTHVEIEKFIIECYEASSSWKRQNLILPYMDILIEINDWNNKFENDNTSKLLEIQEIIDRREQLENKLYNLQLLYENRSKEIQDYLNFKALQQSLQIEKMIRNKFAIKIQKWWRVLLQKKKAAKKKRSKQSAKKIKPKKK